MRDVPTATLLAIGNELLNGEVQDANLFTLAHKLTHLGFSVEQTAMVRDDPPRIAVALLHLLESHPDVLIVCGGLGPTDDDLTLAALAHPLELPLVENAEARRLVEQHYERLLAQGYVPRRGPEKARRKMSTLPQGAMPLHNPVGTAPGVQLEIGETLLFCLPGVPAELEAIFAKSIVPELNRRFGAGSWVEGHLLAGCQDEAEVAALLHEVTPRHPDVYIKSLARPFPAAGDATLRILAASHAAEASVARRRVASALADLRKVLQRAGIHVEMGSP